MNEEKIEIYTFNFIQKKKDDKLKFEGAFLKEIFELFSVKFSNHIDEFPPSKLKNQTVKIEKDSNDKSYWRYNSKSHRLRGVLVIGKDADKVLKFTKLDKKKTSGGKKGKGVNIDKPYYFEMIFVENKSKGFLFLQKTDNTSCKAVIEKLIQSQLDERYETIKLQLNRFIQSDIFEDFLKKGEYNDITFVRNSIPKDVLQDYLGDYQEDGEFTLTTKIKAEGNTSFAKRIKDKIYDSFKDNKTFFESPELDNAGFKENSSYIKVNSTYKGKTITIDLSDTMKVKPVYPLSQVAITEDGYAEFESLSKKVQELIVALDIDIL